ncbi:flagellar hook associated protein [Metarhizobium album]|uniref:Flagellin n=1 Tax=Metarhizobium album TaxID=2182425 RepID=A0A2U2DUY3_9HYPH|nr:flagellin [Rhizobium album]PWE57107.1 flagellar hook associated protein [Rhizobium album]
MSSTSFTNATAASALSLLTGSSKALERNTIHVAAGRNINEAADNAAYWSIAKAMESTGMALSSAEDASGLAAATADTAALGMEAATGIVSEIQAKLILARSSGADKNAINSEITQLKAQLGTVSASTSFSGENWLNAGAGATPGVKSLVASVSTGEDGTTNVNTIEFDTGTTTLTSSNNAADGMLTRAYSGTTGNGSPYEYYMLDAGSTTPAPATAKEIKISDATTNNELDGMISATNSMLSSLTDAGAKLGATASRISANTEFVKSLQETNQRSIGRLVDADMEESVVKQRSLMAQQQLQTIGLNIINNRAKATLDLFR